MMRAHHGLPPAAKLIIGCAAIVLSVSVLVGLVVALGTSSANRPAGSMGNAPGSVQRGGAPASTFSFAPLAGKVVGIDPGHNGGNASHASQINTLVWNGREQETCDTAGAETGGGFAEAEFNFDVAQYLRADLQAEGAQVVMTRETNSGVGPCVDQRSQIINAAHADVAIDIHADGGPPTGRGVAILEPVPDGPNNSVIGSSQAFGADLLRAYTSVTGMPISTYDGTNGVAYRQDLAGLNLTAVPKVLIECGNMANPTDAALLVSSSFQQLAAHAMTESISTFLTGH